MTDTKARHVQGTTWFCKPESISATRCALQGWINTATDTLQCTVRLYGLTSCCAELHSGEYVATIKMQFLLPLFERQAILVMTTEGQKILFYYCAELFCQASVPVVSKTDAGRARTGDSQGLTSRIWHYKLPCLLQRLSLSFHQRQFDAAILRCLNS